MSTMEQEKCRRCGEPIPPDFGADGIDSYCDFLEWAAAWWGLSFERLTPDLLRLRGQIRRALEEGEG